MKAVVKIGGSFQESPHHLKKICNILEEVSSERYLLIVPGGGKFADLVRALQKKYDLSNNTAHEMAILGMNAYGHLLADLLPSFEKTEKLKKESKNRIFLPYQILKDREELEATWDTTSDTIAAWVSGKGNFNKLILVKRVDGISNGNKILKQMTVQELRKVQQTVVDPVLPRTLEKFRIDCWIVNGEHPDRLRKLIVENEGTYTRIHSEV